MTVSKIINDSPLRPTAADIELLASAQGHALATRDLYQVAIDAGAGGDHLSSLVALAAHHDAYAQSISSLIGPAAPQAPDADFMAANRAGFGADTKETALAAHAVENLLIATYTEMIGLLEGTEGSALLASIVIIQARHAVALATIAGLSPLTDTDAFLVTPAAAAAQA